MIEKIGDWSKMHIIANNLQNNMHKAHVTCLKRWGLMAEKIAVTHINKQDLTWTPLNADYLKWKVKKGYSDNILVMTSTYFQSITSIVKGNTAYAGVKKQVKDKHGNIVADIARTHEFGSRSGNIPKRPLWVPTFKETMLWNKLHNLPAKIFLDSLKSNKL